MRTPRPRYVDTWDMTLVTDLFMGDEWNPAEELGMLKLSQKVVVLLLLLISKRAEIVPALELQDIDIDESRVEIVLRNQQLKQGRPGYKLSKIVLETFAEKELCIVHHLNTYLEQRLKLNLDTEVFITSRKPYKAVSRDTVSRWILQVMNAAGIDTNKFKPGSTRAASSSKAAEAGVPSCRRDTILTRPGPGPPFVCNLRGNMQHDLSTVKEWGMGVDVAISCNLWGEGTGRSRRLTSSFTY